MSRVDQWDNFAEMLGNLIAKYANVLDIDSIQDVDAQSNITDEKIMKLAEKDIS